MIDEKIKEEEEKTFSDDKIEGQRNIERKRVAVEICQNCIIRCQPRRWSIEKDREKEKEKKER